MFGLKLNGLVQTKQLNNFKKQHSSVLWTDNWHLRCVARMFDLIEGVSVITCTDGKVSQNGLTEDIFLEKPSITLTYCPKGYQQISKLMYLITAEVQEVFGPNLCLFDYGIRYHADPIMLEDSGTVVIPAVSLEFDSNINHCNGIELPELRARYAKALPSLFELIYNRMFDTVGKMLSIFDLYMDTIPFDDFCSVKLLNEEQLIGSLAKTVDKKQIVSMYSQEDIKEVYAIVTRKSTYAKTRLGLALGQRTSIFRVRNTDVYFIVAHRYNRPTVDYIGCFFCNLETELIRQFEAHLIKAGFKPKELALSIASDFGTYFGHNHAKEEL